MLSFHTCTERRVKCWNNYWQTIEHSKLSWETKPLVMSSVFTKILPSELSLPSVYASHFTQFQRINKLKALSFSFYPTDWPFLNQIYRTVFFCHANSLPRRQSNHFYSFPCSSEGKKNSNCWKLKTTRLARNASPKPRKCRLSSFDFFSTWIDPRRARLANICKYNWNDLCLHP